MSLHSTIDALYYEEPSATSLNLNVSTIEPSFSFSSTYSELIDSLDNIIGESTLKESFFLFSKDNLDFKSLYTVKDNEQKLIDFVQKYRLSDFLLWVNTPIVSVFGDIKQILELTQCWDKNDCHLVLSVLSELDDMDKLTRLEDDLFEKLESYPKIDYALQYIVIAQR